MTVQLTSLVPAASGWSTSWSRTPTSVRSRTRRGRSLSSTARRPRTARSASASVHTTRSDAMRTGPDSLRRTGRQMPPGFQSGSRYVAPWNTPVRLRRAVPGRWGEQVTSTASACSPRSRQCVGDLERVGEEVALGVAQVAAVEPDVSLVEEAVERQPRSPAVRRGRARRTGSGTAAARRCRRSRATSASAPEHRCRARRRRRSRARCTRAAGGRRPPPPATRR